LNHPDHDALATPWPRYRGLWAALLVLAAVWVTAEVSRFFAIATTDDASVIWPPLGIALAASLSLGRRIIPVYALVVGAWFRQRGYDVDVCLVMAVEQGGALLAATEVCRRRVPEPLLSTLGGSLRFYFQVIVLALLPFAAIAAYAYSRMGFFAELGYINIWIFHWLSEAMGVALFAPPTLYLLDWFRAPRRATPNRTDGVFWLAFIALLAAALVAGILGHFNYARGLAYLFFPLLIAGALGGRVLTALVMLPLAVICTVLSVYFGTWQTNQAAWNALGEALAFSAVLGIITQLVVASTVERTRLIAYLREVNHRDQLTGERNRRGLIHRIENTPDPDTGYVAATLCLRNFAHSRELLPDTLVDECENWVVQRIRARLRGRYPELELARVDNGVYALVIHAGDLEQVRGALAEMIDDLKGQTFGAEQGQYQVEPTMGALPFRHGESVADVLTATFHMAREAMNTPGQPLHFGRDYQELLESSREDLRQLETFKRALNEDGFLLFAQEIRPLDAQAGLSKMEFLVRMQGRDGEAISPGAFMPVASRFGYMADLDRWVIRNAFASVAERPELLDQVAQFSINLSGATLSDPQALEHIRLARESSGLDARHFCFEVTETEQVEDWDRALTVLRGIQELGFAVSLDDFGTGLASFDYLNRFQFDYVKIDGSFVRSLDTDTRNREVVEAVVLVARRRGIQTIAEFVENDAIIAELDRLDVDYVQGFGVHRPEPVAGLHAGPPPEPASA
jgi:EAL domain-containing protein (putative c-di-GMP-specific phosphodiesterase class I)/GGDEF domain-containing protein